MKNTFVIIFMLFYFIGNCQLIEKDTINTISNKIDRLGKNYREETKNVPVYKIDPCGSNIFKEIVDNCDINNPVEKYPYGFLFYTKEKVIIIKPIETDWFYNINIYGVFEFYNRKFYCTGIKNGDLFCNVPIDSIELTFHIRNLNKKNDTLTTSLEIDRFSNLDVPEIKKTIICNNKQYYFVIQPCSSPKKKKKK